MFYVIISINIKHVLYFIGLTDFSCSYCNLRFNLYVFPCWMGGVLFFCPLTFLVNHRPQIFFNLISISSRTSLTRSLSKFDSIILFLNISIIFVSEDKAVIIESNKSPLLYAVIIHMFAFAKNVFSTRQINTYKDLETYVNFFSFLLSLVYM